MRVTGNPSLKINDIHGRVSDLVLWHSFKYELSENMVYVNFCFKNVHEELKMQVFYLDYIFGISLNLICTGMGVVIKSECSFMCSPLVTSQNYACMDTGIPESVQVMSSLDL